jgi:hypothetical protein
MKALIVFTMLLTGAAAQAAKCPYVAYAVSPVECEMIHSQQQAAEAREERKEADLQADADKIEKAKQTPCGFNNPEHQLCARIAPSQITGPKGGTIQQLADGTMWVTIHVAGDPVTMELIPGMPTKETFNTVVITNRSDDDIVAGYRPQSDRLDIQGDCQSRTYQIMGGEVLSGKDGGGIPLGDIGIEDALHRVMPDTDTPISLYSR